MASCIVEGLMGKERVDRELEELRSQVQREKERVRRNFQSLRLLLAAREHNVLLELDAIVERARREFSEMKVLLQQLNTAREDLERDLTENKLEKAREKHLRNLEDDIGQVLEGEGVTVGWVEVEWNEKGLQRALGDVCKVCLKEKPFLDYSLKVRPVWSRVTGGEGPDQISNPMQIAIDDTTQKIFLVDTDCNRIQVFDSEGKYIYSITDQIKSPFGIVVKNESIFVSVKRNMLKINKSTNEIVKSVEITNSVFGIEVDDEVNVYGCENTNKSVIVFNANLEFLKRIKLISSHLDSDTLTHSLKLYQNNMYIMFGKFPAFHLQIFTLEGELLRCLIPEEEVRWSYFFCIDRFGNIVVADWGSGGNRIKIFNNDGSTIHTIGNENLPEGEKLDRPHGIALDKSNRIIVAQRNNSRCLQAF